MYISYPILSNILLDWRSGYGMNCVQLQILLFINTANIATMASCYIIAHIASYCLLIYCNVVIPIAGVSLQAVLLLLFNSISQSTPFSCFLCSLFADKFDLASLGALQISNRFAYLFCDYKCPFYMHFWDAVFHVNFNHSTVYIKSLKHVKS